MSPTSFQSPLFCQSDFDSLFDFLFGSSLLSTFVLFAMASTSLSININWVVLVYSSELFKDNKLLDKANLDILDHENFLRSVLQVRYVVAMR